jgi:hypothetical protein
VQATVRAASSARLTEGLLLMQLGGLPSSGRRAIDYVRLPGAPSSPPYGHVRQEPLHLETCIMQTQAHANLAMAAADADKEPTRQRSWRADLC